MGMNSYYIKKNKRSSMKEAVKHHLNMKSAQKKRRKYFGLAAFYVAFSKYSLTRLIERS
jgi:hypothetical protein